MVAVRLADNRKDIEAMSDRHNPWKAGDRPSERPADEPIEWTVDDIARTFGMDAAHYNPDEDGPVTFDRDASERIRVLAEWHAAMRKLHGFEPSPTPQHAVLDIATEAFLGWGAQARARMAELDLDQVPKH